MPKLQREYIFYVEPPKTGATDIGEVDLLDDFKQITEYTTPESINLYRYNKLLSIYKNDQRVLGVSIETATEQPKKYISKLRQVVSKLYESYKQLVLGYRDTIHNSNTTLTLDYDINQDPLKELL